jgi:hypothetical protein
MTTLRRVIFEEYDFIPRADFHNSEFEWESAKEEILAARSSYQKDWIFQDNTVITKDDPRIRLGYSPNPYETLEYKEEIDNKDLSLDTKFYNHVTDFFRPTGKDVRSVTPTWAMIGTGILLVLVIGIFFHPIYTGLYYLISALVK